MNRRQAAKMPMPVPFLPSGLMRSAFAEMFFGVKEKIGIDAQDWSKELCDSQMLQNPDPVKLGNWGYAISLYLYGQVLALQAH